MIILIILLWILSGFIPAQLTVNSWRIYWYIEYGTDYYTDEALPSYDNRNARDKIFKLVMSLMGPFTLILLFILNTADKRFSMFNGTLFYNQDKIKR